MTEVAKCFGISASVSVVGALLMRELRGTLGLAQDEESTATIGAFVSFVATLFTFVLGFTIVNLWTFFNDANRLVLHEATSLRTVYRLAQTMPGGERLCVTLHDYTERVATGEWVAMTGGKMDPHADGLKDAVWVEALALVNDSRQNSTMAASLLGSLVQMNEDRRQRGAMLESKLHPLLRLTLAASALLTIAGFLFLGIKNRRAQFVIDSTMLGVIALNLYLLLALNNPFNGAGFSVPNEAFAALSSRIAPQQEPPPPVSPP